MKVTLVVVVLASFVSLGNSITRTGYPSRSRQGDNGGIPGDIGGTSGNIGGIGGNSGDIAGITGSSGDIGGNSGDWGLPADIGGISIDWGFPGDIGGFPGVIGGNSGSIGGGRGGIGGGLGGTGGIPGGLTEAETNDITVRRIARYAASEIGLEYSFLSVNRAQTQVVSGIMYHLDINVVKRHPSGQHKSFNCDVKVHSQPWMSFRELTEFHCRSA